MQASLMRCRPGRLSVAVDNCIIFADYFHGVARVKSDRVRDHSDLGIDEAKLLFGGVDFSSSKVCVREDELPLKVRHLNQVRVDDPDPAYSRKGEIDRGWNSKTPESHHRHHHGGVLESPLPLGSDFGEDEVSAVALHFVSS